jgi:hypothetical protein
MQHNAVYVGAKAPTSLKKKIFSAACWAIAGQKKK